MRHSPLSDGKRASAARVHEALCLEPVSNELRDRDEREAVLLAEFLELRTARRGTVAIEDLADHTGGPQACEACKIDSGLGVADALQHATVARPQRMDVPRHAKVRT